jgi:beta-phosphoglucomutase-like phosphatase (HAD superfamily)
VTIPYDRTAFDAYIFDCDGTLADTMPIHFKAWTATLEEHLGGKSPLTEEQFYRFGGMPAWRILEVLNEQYGCNLPPVETAHLKEAKFVEMIGDVKPVLPVYNLLKALPLETKTAVASGGLTSVVVHTLEIIHVTMGPGQMIKHVIGYDMVKNGKPAPDLFLHAAELLGAEPSRCLVFEDAEPGFKAAKAAGMTYIDVRPYRTDLSKAAVYEIG